jgi:hypothetical protein
MTSKEGFLGHKSMYRNQKNTLTPHANVDALKGQLKRELLGDLKSILEAQGNNSLTLLGS